MDNMDKSLELVPNIIDLKEDSGDIYDSLIEEVRSNRKNSRDMLDKIKGYVEKIDMLLPTSNDIKHKFVLEEKIKTISNLINSQLSVVRAIDDSVKMEFDLRKKSNKTDTTNLDIYSLAEAMELVETKKNRG